MYSVYDGFAWFYNRYWSRRYHVAAIPVIEKLLLSRIQSGARVLDLCCGSGHLSSYLAGRGFSVLGLDGSKELLEYARINAPTARFLAADARSFSLDEEFRAALCTFDSLNHILEPEEVFSVFRNVYSVLEPGGEFLFDINLEAAYLTMWDKMSAEVEEESVCIIRGRYMRDERLGRTEITAFRLFSEWVRSDTVLFQRPYSAGEITSALKLAGFADIKFHDAQRAGMEGDIATGRGFFTAKRV